MIDVRHNLILLITSAVLPVAGVSCSSAQSPPVSYTSCLAYSQYSTGAASDGWIDVFIYDAEPPYRLDSSIHFDKAEDRFEIGSTSGAKMMVVLANCNPKLLTYDKVIDYESICSILQSIASDDPTRPVMGGSVSLVARGGTEVLVNMTSALCRIVLKKVEIDLSSRPYREKKMEIIRAFLINVNGLFPLVPEAGATMRDIINYSRFDSLGTYSLSHPWMLVSDKVDNANFYCYPSCGEDGVLGSCRTKLVVQTRMDGVTYYYPIPIRNMERGRQYEYSLLITRTGSLDEDTDAEADAVVVECQVKNWKECDESVEDY